MLKITIPAQELYDEKENKIIKASKETTIQLEHSLVSISKWESKWQKPFLSSDEDYQKTHDETIDYIKCMTITQNVDPNVYNYLTVQNIKEVQDYIASPMSATTIKSLTTGMTKKQIITSELIYYWMVANGIPFDCEKWHLNRLIKLIQICSEKNKDPKKMSQNEILNRNAKLNAARRKAAAARRH